MLTLTLMPQWLQTFSVVSELMSFTKAAARLDLTQAAVSQHIAHLESKLGPLLIRRSRQFELTPAGHALLAYCEAVNVANERLALRLSDSDPATGEISIVTPGSVGLAIYALLLTLQQKSNGLVIRHRFAPDTEVLSAVLNNQYELGVVTLKPDDVRLTAALLSEERLDLVVPAGAHAARWEDLQRLGFIDHPDGEAMATRLLSRAYPNNPGVRSLPCNGFTNQIGLILEPVACGLGFTVLPSHARQAFQRQESIRVIEHASPVVDNLWIIHRAEWALSKRAARVVAYLQEKLG